MTFKKPPGMSGDVVSIESKHTAGKPMFKGYDQLLSCCIEVGYSREEVEIKRTTSTRHYAYAAKSST